MRGPSTNSPTLGASAVQATTAVAAPAPETAGELFIKSLAVLPTPPPSGQPQPPLLPVPQKIVLADGVGARAGSDVNGVRAKITDVISFHEAGREPVAAPAPPPAMPATHATTSAPMQAGSGVAASSSDARRRTPRPVRFSTVTVHFHEREVGGSSGVPSSGVDLGIGWKTVAPSKLMAVEEFEAEKAGDDDDSDTERGASGDSSSSDDEPPKSYRYDNEGKLDARERRRIMRAAGFTESHIDAAIKAHKVCCLQPAACMVCC